MPVDPKLAPLVAKLDEMSAHVLREIAFRRSGRIPKDGQGEHRFLGARTDFAALLSQLARFLRRR